MIISEVIPYSQRNGLGVPGFAPRTAKYVINCKTKKNKTPVEKDFSVTVLGNVEDKKNPGVLFNSCPETPGMNSGGKSHVLLETLDVVFGLSKTLLEDRADKTEDEKKKEAGLLAKHDFFVESLRLMSPYLPEASHFAYLLQDSELCKKLYLVLTTELKAKGSDKITLAMSPDDDEDMDFLVKDERWRPWWVDYRKTLGKGGAGPEEAAPQADDSKKKTAGKSAGKQASKPSKSTRMVSVATGEIVEPVPTHPQLTELSDVGASAMGASFIGFDKASLQSFGLDQSANAAMDETSASQYRGGLNDILKNRSKRFGNVKIGYWYKIPVAAEDDPVAMIEGVKDEDDWDIRKNLNAAGALLESWETGQKEAPAGNSYHSLILSGNAGRVIIRDWSTGDLVDWVKAADRWFSDTAIVRRDGSGLMAQHKFYAIIGSLLRDLTGRELEACSPMIVALWKAALNPQINIPEIAVNLALRRIRIEMYGDKDGKVPPANHARMGLLRAYLVRNTGDTNMEPYLNEDHPDCAYQCGRLMSLIADLQYAALGDVNAGIVQRFYSSASVSPQLVFGRLMRMSQFYFGKIEGAKAFALEGRIADVWGKIKDDIPPTFSLKQQTLFAEGYYQEQAYRRKAVSDAKAEKAAKAEKDKA